MSSVDDSGEWFGEARDEPPSIVPASLAQAPIDPKRRQRVKETLATYEREIAASVDPRRRAMLAYEIGRIHEYELGDDRRAVRFYQRAFRSDPTHLPTLQAGQRVFARGNRWGMVLRLAEAESRTHPSKRRRARLLARQADLYLTRFGRPHDALACARKALALTPDDADLIRTVAQLAAIVGDHASSGDLLCRAADLEAEPRLAHTLKLAAARARLVAGDTEGAQGLLDDLARAEPVDPEALALLRRVRRSLGQWQAYIEVSARLATTLPAPARARLLTDLARTAADQLDDVVGALALLEQAIVADARAPTALELIVELRARSGEWQAAAEALQRLVVITENSEARIERLWQLAQVRLDRLGDEDGAIAAVQTLLADAPTWAPAVRMLGRLLAERGDWDGLVALHTSELRAMTDARARAARYFKIGEVHELQRDDPMAAGAAYRSAVEHDPDFKQAGKALARMLIRLGEWEAYVELLEAEAERASDVQSAVYVLGRVAEVYALQLNDPERALQAWRRLLDLDPANLDAVRTMARLCDRTGRWEELLDANERELDLIAGAPGELDLLVRSAEIAERALNELMRARDFLERALRLDPHFLPALQAMGRIARRLRNWHELAALFETEAEVTASSREKVVLLSKLAELRAEQLEDVDGAIEAHEAAVTHEPTHLASIRALQRLYALRGDAANEARMIVAEAEQVTEPRARAILFDRLGRLRAERMGEPQLAAAAWRRALNEMPRFQRALHGLIDAQTQARDFEALIETYRQLAEVATTPDEAVEHWLEVARVNEDHLGAPLAAIDALELVVRLNPRHMGALLGLERLYLARADADALVRVYAHLLDVVQATRSRADVFCRRARLRAEQLGDIDGALADYLAALALAPNRREAIIWVESHAAENGDVERLAAVLERRLAVSDAPQERQNVLARAAEVLRRAGRLSEAAACYEAVIQLEPDAVVAIRALREIYESLGEVTRVLQLAEAEGRRSLDPRTAAALLVEAGTAREGEVADPEGALAAYLEALARNPADEAALVAVRRICERQGRWEVLAETLEERAETLPSPSARHVQLLEAADIRARRLDDAQGAIALLQRGIDASEAPAARLLQRQGDLLCEIGDWRGAADVYATLCSVSPDADLRRAVVYRLATIYQDKLDDLERAGECLELILAEHPDERGALPRLARVYHSMGAIDEARSAFQVAIEREDDLLLSAELRQELAQIEASAGRPEQAVVLLTEVLAVAPDALDAATRFAALCVQIGDPETLQRVLRPAIGRIVDRPTTANRLRQLLAASLIDAGGTVEESMGMLEEAIAAAAGDAELRAAHASLAERYPEHWGAALASRRWLAMQRPLDTANLKALHGLFSRMGRVDPAYEVARLLIGLGAADVGDRRSIQQWHDHVRRWPRRAISDDDRRVARVPGPSAAFGEVLAALSSALPDLFAPAGGPVRIAPPALSKLVGRVCEALGWPSRAVGIDCRQLGTALPLGDAIVFSEALLELEANEQAFIVASQIELVQRGVSATLRWPPVALRGLLDALAAVGGHPVASKVLDPDSLASRASRLAPRLERSAHPDLPAVLERLRAVLPTLDLAHARAAFSASAGRIAMLCCGGILPAVKALRRIAGNPPPARTPGVADLVRWSVTEPYFAQRRAVGLVSPG